MADEALVWRKVDACVNLSPAEQNTIKQYQPNSHFILPLINTRKLEVKRSWASYCETNNLHDSLKAVESFDLVLWGDYHPANIASTQWFIESVVLSGALGNVKTFVIGRVGEQIYNRMGSRPGISYGGFVDSLDDAFLKSKLLVLPDQSGSGISVKTMEALAVQRPFVATSLALRSLELGGSPYSGSNDVAELVADCAKLLKSEKARAQRVAVAKKIYDLNFSREVYYSKWDKVMASVGITPHSHEIK
jgi:glycosyltransferase involved in cell wall biosynthesis